MKKKVIEVISPSDDITKIPMEVVERTRSKLKERTGLDVKFSKHIFEEYSPEKALEDLYEAYTDDRVGLVMCYKGGNLANKIVNSIDYDIIKKNKKPMIGYSDNAILLNAIYLKTGQKNYYGPTFSAFNMDLGFDFTLSNFNDVVRDNKNFKLNVSDEYSYDRKWYKNQNDRLFVKNENNIQVINSGVAEGVILGGHMSSFMYLLNNGFTISDNEVILMVEEDGGISEDSDSSELFKKSFKEKLKLLIDTVGIDIIKAILIGRSQVPISKQEWADIINELELKIPAACNLDFGHTNPTLSIPIGERIKVNF